MPQRDSEIQFQSMQQDYHYHLKSVLMQLDVDFSGNLGIQLQLANMHRRNDKLYVSNYSGLIDDNSHIF